MDIAIPVRIVGGALRPGEMRPIVDHTWQRFAAACCPRCEGQAFVTEGQFRVLARNPDAALRCRRCPCAWHPIERLVDTLPRDLGTVPPRDGWL